MSADPATSAPLAREVVVTALLPRATGGQPRATRMATYTPRAGFAYNRFKDPNLYFVWPIYGPPHCPDPPCLKTLDRIEAFVRAECARGFAQADSTTANIPTASFSSPTADPPPIDDPLVPSAAREPAVERPPTGYRNPPLEHQFRQGDGRARGRRKKGTPNAKTILRQEHNRPIKLREEDGAVRRRRAIELVIRRDVLAAVKDNEKAKARQIKYAMEIAEEDEARAALKSQRQTLAEDEAILARYLEGAKPDPPSGNQDEE